MTNYIICIINWNVKHLQKQLHGCPYAIEYKYNNGRACDHRMVVKCRAYKYLVVRLRLAGLIKN